VISALSPDDRESDQVVDYTGLFWRRPRFAALLTLSLLSLAGIPLTAGFVGKFYLFTAAGQAALWPLLAIFVAGSGIGLYYYLRVVFRMASADVREEGSVIAGGMPLTLGAETALAFLALSIAVLGMLPSSLIEFLAASMLR
jgi:NADH-quinone oxidoreductase subunit N